jgi:hypothetical protein
MKEVLKDCLSAIHDLSLEIYILMSSSLKDIDYIQKTSDMRFSSVLINKLLKIAVMIEDNRYRSTSEPAFQGFTHSEADEDSKDLGQELEVRVSRITARILNIWKKIVTPQKESGIICCCFLLLYCEVDKSIQISHSLRVKYDRAVNLMREYSANPGYVVTVVRKTRDYIEKEQISPEIIRRIHEALGKTTYDQVRNMDNTFTALALYELVLFATKFFQDLYKKRYGFDVFDRNLLEPLRKPVNLSGKTFGISQSENFGIVLSVDSPRPSTSRSPLKRPSLNPLPLKSLSMTQSPVKLRISSTARAESKEKFKPATAFLMISPQKTPSKTRVFKSGLKSVSPVKKTRKEERFSLESRFLPSQPSSRSSNSLSPRKNKGLEKSETVDHGDLLEEMQYQQFIEEKFRNFLVSKLNDFEFDDSIENRIKNEEKVFKNREVWMKEFESKIGAIRFNAIKKLGDEKRFTAEMIRAQKQLELMEKRIKPYQ